MSKIQTVSKDIAVRSAKMLDKVKEMQQELATLNQTIVETESSLAKAKAREAEQKRMQEALEQSRALAEQEARESVQKPEQAVVQQATVQKVEEPVVAPPEPPKVQAPVEAPPVEAPKAEKPVEPVKNAPATSSEGFKRVPGNEQPPRNNRTDRPAQGSGQFPNRYDQNNRQGDRPANAQQGQGQRPFTPGQGGTRAPYNNDRRPQGQATPGTQGQTPRPAYGQGQRPPYNQNGTQGQRPPYNQNGTQGQRPPYNQGGTQGQRPPYGQGGAPGQRPPYGQGGAQGQRPPYGQGGAQGQRPPYGQGGTQGPRPGGFAAGGAAGPRRKPGGGVELTPTTEKGRVSNYDPNKKQYPRSGADDKKTPIKKPLTRGGFVSVDDEDERIRGRKKARKEYVRPEPIVIDHAIITTEEVSVKVLAEKIGKPVAAIVKKLFLLGIMATINHEIDFDTAALVASEFGVTLEHKVDKTYEETLQDEHEANINPEALVERPPVVTIMGHVDHGKTSLLDAIRATNVTSSEAGGITQHIGAYTIEINKRQITFIDTPGHEAFTSMRARGAQVTDVAILVVAADDGVMPQTIEAINHAKAAKVPIIVAINKMDKPSANPDRIKQDLTQYGLVAEDWGGETIIAPVSAVTKEGIENLLEMILLVADVQQLKADPTSKARGTIIEARLDKGRGPVATVLIQNGTLHIGDMIVAGVAYGRVRAMLDDKGNKVEEAGPSMPVEVLGFNDVPEAGDIMQVAEDDKLSKQVAHERRDKLKAAQLKAMSKISLDELFTQISEGQIKDLNVIVKADVQGSVEAVKQALERLTTEQVRVRAIHGGVGAITEWDVMLASASNAIIIAFNVRPEAMAREAAERENVDIRLYRVIYNAIEDIEKAMKGMLEPVFHEVLLGHAEVRTVFKVTGVGTIAGCYVTDGKIARNAKLRLLRDNVVIHEGDVASLKRFKDDAKEVASGYECGIGIEGYNDIKEHDVIEAYNVEKLKED